MTARFLQLIQDQELRGRSPDCLYSTAFVFVYVIFKTRNFKITDNISPTLIKLKSKRRTIHDYSILWTL